MPCLVVIAAFFLPRVVIAVLALATDYMSRAYDTLLWPLLGFLFAPYTTLAYAFAMNEKGSLSGFHLLVFIIAILLDLGSNGSADRSRRKRAKKA